MPTSEVEEVAYFRSGGSLYILTSSRRQNVQALLVKTMKYNITSKGCVEEEGRGLWFHSKSDPVMAMRDYINIYLFPILISRYYSLK